jgi:integrase
MGKLTQRDLARLANAEGRHRDGDTSLYFTVRNAAKGLRFWTLRYRLKGRQSELSLGAYPETSLAQARERYAEKHALIIKGEDPIAEKHARRSVAPVRGSSPTFGAVAENYIETHERSWRSAKHARQWRACLLGPPPARPDDKKSNEKKKPPPDYCAAIRNLPVAKIDTAAVLAALKPMWKAAPESASRVRGRIETVLDAARALGHIDENRANPARWKGHLENLLPKVPKAKNFVAMLYKDVPAFVAELRRPTTAARALEFLILTAARAGEVRGMVWDEVDFDEKTWTIPAERLKAGALHRVPLNDRAVEILRTQREAGKDNPHVFPGARPMKGLNESSFQELMRRMGRTDVTIHGFRSAFRDWAGDETSFPREVAEQALAHVIGGVEGDYRRSDALLKRRRLMDAWGAYCVGEPEYAKKSRADHGPAAIELGDARRLDVKTAGWRPPRPACG